MESLFTLLFAPTLPISLLIESENVDNRFTANVASFLLFSRCLLLPPATPLKMALQSELKARGNDGKAISANLLRIVDNAVLYERYKASRIFNEECDNLKSSLAFSAAISPIEPTFTLLGHCLDRVLRSYAISDKAVARSTTVFATDESQDYLLRELWGRLKPGDELGILVTKRWQEIGFQNTSPTTDFRGAGVFALDCLLHFAKEYDERAVEVMKESVDGVNWYPFALASIHMTAFVLDLAAARDLQLLLLRSLQTVELSTVNAGESSADEYNGVDLEPILRIHSNLLLLFHAHWLRNKFTVMQFEQVSKSFQATLRPFIRRGIIDSRPLGWSVEDETSLKED